MGNTMFKKPDQRKTSDQYKCDEVIINSKGSRLIAIKIYAGIENNIHQNKNQKVILFIHGVAGSSYVWHKQIEYFISYGYKVVSIDIVGHGNSSKLPSYDDYCFNKLADDCLTIFDQVCSDKKRNIVVGHSYGCSMATVVAHDRPSLVSRLVLISGGSAKPLGPSDGLFESPLCCMICIHPIVMFFFRKKTFYRNTESLTMKQLSINVDSFVLKAMMLGQMWDEGGDEYHQQITVPTLLIHGNEDEIVSIEEEWDMQIAIRHCILETIDNVGHFAMLEAPSEVNRLIKNHIERDWESQLENMETQSFCRHDSVIKKIKIEHGHTLYEKKLKSKLQNSKSFSEFDKSFISDDFDIAGRKTLPSGFITSHKSTIRRKTWKKDSIDQSASNTIMEDIVESSF